MFIAPMVDQSEFPFRSFVRQLTEPVLPPTQTLPESAKPVDRLVWLLCSLLIFLKAQAHQLTN